ncbi:MAG: DUF3891 family protein [Candidatus Eiseniibacteriota bacterium]
MIVQKRTGSLRLIRQHDHALASGRLALEWVGNGAKPEALSLETVLGVSLHDVGWSRADETPRRDEASGGVVGFETFPAEERAALYEEGLDFVERVHPWCALLCTMHYAGFGVSEDFRRRQKARRERLERTLPLGPEDVVRARYAHACLRHFDDLSLVACLAGPLALDPPPWLDADRVAKGPDGILRDVRWRDEEAMTIHPFPFRQPVVLEIPCRDLPLRFEGPEELRAAWDAAPWRRHQVRLVPRDDHR